MSILLEYPSEHSVALIVNYLLVFSSILETIDQFICAETRWIMGNRDRETIADGQQRF